LIAVLVGLFSFFVFAGFVFVSRRIKRICEVRIWLCQLARA